eukprot:931654-Prymnesium_polylepis.2
MSCARGENFPSRTCRNIRWIFTLATAKRSNRMTERIERRSLTRREISATISGDNAEKRMGSWSGRAADGCAIDGRAIDGCAMARGGRPELRPGGFVPWEGVRDPR